MSKTKISDEWAPSCSLATLTKRAQLLAAVRRFFADHDVLEVETPSLCQATVTDPNLGCLSTRLLLPGEAETSEVYLQTSPEFAMKRLLAAGSGSIYQICKGFRNEESGRYHNPEFTLLEWYRIGFNLDRLMDEVECLLMQLFESETRLDAAKRWRYRDVFYRYCKIDPLESEIRDFSECAMAFGLAEGSGICGDDPSQWLDFLFSHLVQPRLAEHGLVTIYDYPACQAALARLRPDQPEVAERMEVFLNGVELGNGYHELIDAREQQRRFAADREIRRKRGLPVPAMDLRFLAALKAGLPACSGFAIGLDRVLMLMMGAVTIDSVLAFSVETA